MKSAICAKCDAPANEAELMRHIHMGKVLYCKNEVNSAVCNGPIKPDIKFYGQTVGNNFVEAWEKIEDPTIDDATIDGTKDALMSMTNSMEAKFNEMRAELNSYKIPKTYEDYA